MDEKRKWRDVGRYWEKREGNWDKKGGGVPGGQGIGGEKGTEGVRERDRSRN